MLLMFLHLGSGALCTRSEAGLVALVFTVGFSEVTETCRYLLNVASFAWLAGHQISSAAPMYCMRDSSRPRERGTLQEGPAKQHLLGLGKTACCPCGRSPGVESTWVADWGFPILSYFILFYVACISLELHVNACVINAGYEQRRADLCCGYLCHCCGFCPWGLSVLCAFWADSSVFHECILKPSFFLPFCAYFN